MFFHWIPSLWYSSCKTITMVTKQYTFCTVTELKYIYISIYIYMHTHTSVLAVPVVSNSPCQKWSICFLALCLPPPPPPPSTHTHTCNLEAEVMNRPAQTWRCAGWNNTAGVRWRSWYRTVRSCCIQSPQTQRCPTLQWSCPETCKQEVTFVLLLCARKRKKEKR